MSETVRHGGIHKEDTNRAVQVHARDQDWLHAQIKRKNFDNFNAALDEILAKKGKLVIITRPDGARIPTWVWEARKADRDLIRKGPIKIAKKIDMVVTAGLTHFAKLGTGDSALSWRYMAAGTGTNAEGAGNTALQTELARIDLDAIGDRFPSGTSLKFAGFFVSTTPSGTYSEFGVLNAASVGDLFTRTVLPSAPTDERIPHTINLDAFAFTQIVTQTGS